MAIKSRYLLATVIQSAKSVTARLSLRRDYRQISRVFTRHVVSPKKKINKMAEHVCGLWVVNKKKTKSSVWRYFSLLAMEDGKVIER